MIYAGIGCRKGVTPAEIVAALDAALRDRHCQRASVAGLATGGIKRAEPAIPAAAALLGLPLSYIGDEALAEVDGLVATRSGVSLEQTGSASLSEASALAAAGAGATLLGPRSISGAVTCALAETVP